MLKILNLEAGYGPLRVLKGISLHVSPGEAVAIIGANGAGKTTLLKTVAGVLKPRSGSVSFDKREIHGTSPERIVSLGCSLVPEGRHVFGTMTVRENLLLGAYPRPRKDRKARDIEAGLEEVLRPVRHPPRTGAPVGRHAFGRAAADAGDRSGADVQA